MLRYESFADFGRKVRRQQLECLAFVLSIVLQHLPLVVAGQHDLSGAVGHCVSAVLGESFDDGIFRPLLAKENFALIQFHQALPHLPRVRRADDDFRWIAGSARPSHARILDPSQSLGDGSQVMKVTYQRQ